MTTANRRCNPGPWGSDRHREARPRARRDCDCILDGRLHEVRSIRQVREGERAGEAIGQPVVAIQRARAGALGQSPRPGQRRSRHRSGAHQRKKDPRGTFPHQADLPQRNVRDGNDERRTERLCTHMKRAAEPDTTLGLSREPTNLLDSVPVAGHQACRL
jgi:hypothetical protein